MTGRKLLIALAAAALYAVVLVTTASAEMRRLQVTLVTGDVMVVEVNVPAGQSPQSVPGLPAAAERIVDLGPVATPTPSPTPTTTPTPTPTAPAVTPSPAPGAPTPTPTPGPGGDETGDDDGASTPGDAPARTRGRAQDQVGNVESAVGRARDEAPSEAAGDDEPADQPPTPDDPSFSLAEPGPARIGVPNFFIDKFRIPPFLLPIYQAAGIEYGIRWEILAAINEIETDYGRNLNISSAGALGWMQFMPPTWKAYGVDANNDGLEDPYNPVDAIFAAARYLRAAGADQDIRQAVFAYNHADWYVDSVLMRAQVIGGLPSNLVGSLSGLTQGRFPVQARAKYAGRLEPRGGEAATATEPGARRGIRIFARSGAPVVAVNDGRIVEAGRSARLGRYVTLQDVYGNTYTYGHLDRVAERYPAPKPRELDPAEVQRELEPPTRDAAPTRPASSTDRPARRGPELAPEPEPGPAAPVVGKERLFANPTRPNAAQAGGAQQEFERTGLIDGHAGGDLGLDREDIQLKRLREGARVVAGTVLGRIGRVDRGVPHVLFEIRPAGRGAPRVDPKPILDGWKLLESTAIYRAAGRNPFFGADAANPSIGQILLMSKEALVARVLANPRIDVYGCGRTDIRAGQVDRRVLATLEFLAASGLRPTVSSLTCGHGYYTASGNVSHHSSGNAVDISAINGIAIAPETQGTGSITEMTIQRLLTLQGTMKPTQIISLMDFEGVDNTFAMGDHHDHIHVGWQPLYGTNAKLAKRVNAILEPRQWIKLIDRLGEIDNPTVRRAPSKFALERASSAHKGE